MPSKGFTLIELMIVIVMILSLFAAVTYTEYVRRTYVSEGINLASSAKIAAAVYSAEYGINPPNNTVANLGVISGAAVNSIEIEADTITITYNKVGSGTVTLAYETSSSNNKTGIDKLEMYGNNS